MDQAICRAFMNYKRQRTLLKRQALVLKEVYNKKITFNEFKGMIVVIKFMNEMEEGNLDHLKGSGWNN